MEREGRREREKKRNFERDERVSVGKWTNDMKVK